jgi:hypothetical protein
MQGSPLQTLPLASASPAASPPLARWWVVALEPIGTPSHARIAPWAGFRRRACSQPLAAAAARVLLLPPPTSFQCWVPGPTRQLPSDHRLPLPLLPPPAVAGPDRGRQPAAPDHHGGSCQRGGAPPQGQASPPQAQDVRDRGGRWGWWVGLGVNAAWRLYTWLAGRQLPQGERAPRLLHPPSACSPAQSPAHTPSPPAPHPILTPGCPPAGGGAAQRAAAG